MTEKKLSENSLQTEKSHTDSLFVARSPVATLSEAIEKSNCKVLIGLVQQGHMDTVEKMLAEGKTWEDIGKAINWHGPAVCKMYYMEKELRLFKLSHELTIIADLRDKIANMRSELETLKEQAQGLDASQHYQGELDGIDKVDNLLFLQYLSSQEEYERLDKVDLLKNE
jgi:hypothetical protein